MQEEEPNLEDGAEESSDEEERGELGGHVGVDWELSAQPGSPRTATYPWRIASHNHRARTGFAWKRRAIRRCKPRGRTR